MSVLVDHKITYGVIGIGNAGSQVAAMAHAQLGIDALAFNSAHQDASQVTGIEVVVFGDGNGTARDRDFAKQQFLRDAETHIKAGNVRTICANKVVFVVASTGGGTGSGIGPSMYKVLRARYGEHTNFVFIGILPFGFEDANMRINTIECLNELVGKIQDPTYVLFSNALSAIAEHRGVAKINKAIIDFMYMLMGKTEVQTELTAIDDQELLSLIRTPGRMIAFNITKDISKFNLPMENPKAYMTKILHENFSTSFQPFTLVDDLEENTANTVAIITHLESEVQDALDYGEIMKAFNKPINMLQHTAIKNSSELEANLGIIAAGLGYPTTYMADVQKVIKDQIDMEKSREKEEEPLPLGIDVKTAKEFKATKAAVVVDTEASVADLLKDFI